MGAWANKGKASQCVDTICHKESNWHIPDFSGKRDYETHKARKWKAIEPNVKYIDRNF